jgi:hypothetical protein
MRDALPQHEINGIVNRLAAGEELEEIQASMPSVAPIWFERNAESLHRLSGRKAAAAELAGDAGDDGTGDGAPAAAEASGEGAAPEGTAAAPKRRRKAKQSTE